MKSSLRLSELKESLLDVIKQSTQKNDQKNQEAEDRMQFYRRFYTLKKLQNCQISQISIVTSSFWRSYAIYTIQILTAEFQYRVNRRFSDFQQFYNKHRLDQHLDIKLPAKTFFKAGWAEDVTKQRTVQLNSLIEKVLLSQNEALHCALYEFLKIYQHYEEQGLIDKEQEVQEQESLISDEELIQKMIKIRQQPSNSLVTLKQIKFSLFERKKRVPYEIAKHFLLGFGNSQGFISLVMKNTNEIVTLEGLQMLVDLLSPQTNRDYDVFAKLLSRCAYDQLILTSCDITSTHSIVKVTYFEFLRLYKQVKGDQAVLEVLETYENEQQLLKQYQNWQKLQKFEGRG